MAARQLPKLKTRVRFPSPAPSTYNEHLLIQMANDTSSPLISVIIPVYNTEKYLADCLDSVINQTISNIEIICVNDGSPDNSLQILKQYASRDKRIKILEQPNSGVIAARNNGISVARGEYILCLDSDDRIASVCLERLYNALINEPCDLALPSVALFGNQTGLSDLGAPTADNMCAGNRIYSTCGLYKKELWKKYGGYDSRFANGIEDYDFWMNFFQDNRRIVKVPDVLFYYNVKPASESRNEQTEKYHQELFKLITSKYSFVRKYNRKRSIYFVSKPNRYFRIIHIFRIPIVIPRNDSFRWLFHTILRPFQLIRMAQYMMNLQSTWSKTFVSLSNKHYSPKPNDVKIIAYYLPQFYHFPQNMFSIFGHF